MDCICTRLPYHSTGFFSSIVTDYLKGAEGLKPFFVHPVSIEGISAAIANRKQFHNNRGLLVEVLKEQYAGLPLSAAVQSNIELLSNENTFTITTAHQPAIFTGTLYFIYKILHAIKLAAHLKELQPENNFVPVFYMGCEDADLDELGTIYLSGDKITWDAKQTGAVGRMKTKGLEKIIARIDGELSVLPFGKELLQLLKDAYLHSDNVQDATFKLLHSLFADYGLVVLIPDNAKLKKAMIPVFEDDLFNSTSSAIVNKTIGDLDGAGYKVQANPRDINLFYLKDNVRGRIEKVENTFIVHESEYRFTADEIKEELSNHPERFSPNVILRGLFQETILPNIAFVGGGGELAYWLELKNLFNHYAVPYPVLVLRNSFLFIEKKWQEKIDKLGLTLQDIFMSGQDLLTKLVTKNKNGELSIHHELEEVQQLYSALKSKAGNIDKTLQQHIEALQSRTIKPLQELEKKMLRAEKRKYEDEQRHIHAVKNALFPFNNLQERIDNFMPYYAKWGKAIIPMFYDCSLTLEQEFVVMNERS